MHGYETILTWVSVGLLLAALFLNFSRKNLLENIDREQKSNADHRNQLIEIQKTLNENRFLVTDLKFRERGLQSLIDEQAKAFPWLLSARIQFDDIYALRDAQFLEKKRHPAFKSADLVREYRSKMREMTTLLNRTLYRQRYAEKLFPWLSDLLDEDLEQLLTTSTTAETEEDDNDLPKNPAQEFLSYEEYMQKSETERNQMALDRYEKSRRTNWQIGRDFERYVGYLLEDDGYDVQYFGAVEGLSDLGRDLIATRNEQTLIVQCKYWSKSKTIHEKHIYQLYGTFCDYVISNNLQTKGGQGQLFAERDALHNVKPLFLTTAQLSERAKIACELLGVEAKVVPMEKWVYPKIKCNISQRDGAKIYHLPFDQQYDRIKIEKSKGESFELTCEKAEQLGFRRAWRWKGNLAG